MTERILDLIVDESKWLPVALLVSLLVVAIRRVREGRQPSSRQRISQALQLFFGCVIGVMAIGHLLAVTVKATRGTLEGSPAFLYPIGLALAIPAWWLAVRSGGARKPESLVLNAWLAVTLIALGLHNLPLAVPGILNIGYRLHTRRLVGWAIVAVTIAGYATLLVGALVFAASGQSFEQFRGIE